MHQSSKYKNILFLILIVFLAFSVRIGRYCLDSRVEKDSVLYINMAKDWNEKGIEHAFDRNPRISPLYIFLMMLGEKAGLGAELTGVIISIFAGSLTALSVFLLAIVFMEEKLALIAAFLAALHPIFIKLSPEVIRDSLFIFCYISSIALFVNSIEKRKIYLWLLAGFFASLAAMTRSEGAELILIPFAWLALEFILEYLKTKKTSTETPLVSNILLSLKIVLKKYISGIACAVAIFSICSFPVQMALKNSSSTWTVFDSRMMGYLEFATKKFMKED